MRRVNGSALQEIPLGELRNVRVAIAPLAEQKKIAEILSTWDRAIEVAEAQLDCARTQKRALMQQLLTGRRRFPEFEGREWISGKLVDHFDFINGRAFKPSDWGEVGLPIIRIQNLTGSTDAVNYYDGAVDEKHMVRDGDFLLSWSATLDTYIWQGVDAVLNQHIFKVVPKSDTLMMFGFHLITYEIGKLVSKVHGTSMKHITKKDLSKIISSFPSIPEQERIVGVLNDAVRECEVVEISIAKLRAEKKALMQQLLTGKRRVSV
jgi:type I restriction enzyme S subunit